MAFDQPQSTLEVAAEIAQVVIGLGAIVSIWIGLASLREVRRERIQKVRPWLAFDHGGQFVRCEKGTTNGLPGMNRAFIQTLVGGRPRSVRKPISHWGKLRNHGGGVALDVRVTFVTTSAMVGSETFSVQYGKLQEFPYDLRLNRIPASPTHIHPGEEGTFFRLPAPIFEREGSRAEINGIVVISCSDILAKAHARYQTFRAAVEDRLEGEAEGVLLTFGDELPPDEARERLGDSTEALPSLADEKGSLPSRVAGALVKVGLGGSGV